MIQELGKRCSTSYYNIINSVVLHWCCTNGKFLQEAGVSLVPLHRRKNFTRVRRAWNYSLSLFYQNITYIT